MPINKKSTTATVKVVKLKYTIASKLNLLSSISQSSIKNKVVKELKVTEQTYYRWLRIPMTSKSKIPYDAIMCFSRVLDVPHTELFNS